METIRINELARELEVKSKAILDYLSQVGVTDKKSHSSALEGEIVQQVRAHFRGVSQGEGVEEPPQATHPGVTVEAETHPPAPADGKKTPEARPDLHPIGRSLDEIKAEARRATAPPPPPRPAPAVEKPLERRAEISAAGPATAASPAGGARPLPTLPSRTSMLRPGAPPATVSARIAALAPAPVRRAGPASEPLVPVRPGEATGTKPLRATRSTRLSDPASSQPIYPQAIRPKGVPQRVIGQRRPGEPRPMHPTAARPAGASASTAAMGGVPATRPPLHRPAGPPPSSRFTPSAPFPTPRLAVPEEVPITRQITLSEGISIKDLSEKLDVRAKEVIKRLLDRGIFATINQTLDSETATQIARSFGAEATVISFEEVINQEVEEADRPEDLRPRPPVVTVMGHVDHGKTSLLDAIRETNVAAKEAGGITQRIGAYQAEVQNRKITFIDTPGHEAFTMMRARGAKATDIVVLVVAADDGVMPQTLEAISHARAAKVPIVVAINKIDKPEAQPERVKKQLADHGLMAEEWGGDTVTVEVSAKQHTKLELLLEMILLVADLQQLKANPNRLARGTVLEAKLDRGRGPVATALVQNGTLRVFVYHGLHLRQGASHVRLPRTTRDRSAPIHPCRGLGFGRCASSGRPVPDH